MARLIDADALKEEIGSWGMNDYEPSDFIDAIEDAPTVTPEKLLVANVTFDEDKLKEIVQTEVIDKIKSGELVLKAERPQGEWKDYSDEGFLECPFCQHATTCEDNIDELHYCWNCGAKLKKGGADNE